MDTRRYTLVDGIVFDNSPVYGCKGCDTTGGRASCPKHGIFNTTIKEPVWSFYEGREETGEEYFIR